MIDTDKYERMLKDDDGRNNVLALDLLAEVKRCHEIINASSTLKHISKMIEEVKRLREELRLTKEWLHQLHDEELNSAFRHHVYGDDVEVIE
jgi:protein subunit release factor A